MLRQKSIFVLIIISTVLLFHSGCNLVISMIESNTPPVAISCNDYEAPVNKTALLDGKKSYDPDGDNLSYVWIIQFKPGESQLENADIKNRKTDVASAVLDKEGVYEFKLTVSDGNDDSSDILCISAVPEPTDEPHDPTPEPEDTPEPTTGPTGPATTPEITPAPNATPPYGLTIEYLCNGDARDSSEYENHGKVEGAQLYPDRNNINGKAYFFNGSGDNIDCGNGYSLNTYDELTIALWVRSNNLNRGVILSKRENEDIGYELRIDSSAIAFSDGSLILAASVLGEDKLEKWFHVAVTWKPFDPDNLPLIYINGTLKFVNSERPETFQPSSAHLYIGKSDIRTGDYYYGAIDDLRIYDRILSEEEINDLMNLYQ